MSRSCLESYKRLVSVSSRSRLGLELLHLVAIPASVSIHSEVLGLFINVVVVVPAGTT